MHSPLKVKSWYHCSLSGSHHIRSPSLTCSSDYRVFIVSFDSFCHNERITAHEVTNLGNVFTVLPVRQLEVTQLLSEKIPSDRMRPCKCSLPCCFSWRWCHRLERAGGREGGRFGEDGGVFLADCIIKPLRQALSAPLSPVFFPLCHFPPVADAGVLRGGRRSESEVSRGEGNKTKKQSNTSSASLAGKMNETDEETHAVFFFFLFKHTPQIFALDDAFPLRPACVRRFDLATSTWTSTCWNTLTNIFLFRVVDCG